MSSFWVCDLEADGLLEDVTRIWCFVAKELGKDNWIIYKATDIEGFPGRTWKNMLDGCRLFIDNNPLIFHNGIKYDIPVIKKVTGLNPTNKIIDTLVWSRVNNPDRQGQEGGKNPHSIEAWGQRFGHPKVKHEDWTQYSPEMLHRCIEDVNILEKVAYELFREEFK